MHTSHQILYNEGESMLELYHSHFSTCSQKVRLCLAEKNLDFVSHPLNFTHRDHLTPEYLALNPNGVVPTLINDGKVIIESSVICEYLDEIWPALPLMPVDPFERARARAWMRYIEEVPTASIRIPSFNKLFSSANGALSDTEFQQHVSQLPLRKHFYLKMHEGKFSDSEYEGSIERLEQTLDRMQSALTKNKWLANDEYSLADLILIPTLVRMEDLGLSTLWADKPKVSDWLNRVQQRPSFGIAYYPGSRTSVESFSIEAAEAKI
tara:strand:+ start:510 stop:1307 length:798 start_codon:yes stop_codon:yes gene_type:complete